MSFHSSQRKAFTTIQYRAILPALYARVKCTLALLLCLARERQILAPPPKMC